MSWIISSLEYFPTLNTFQLFSKKLVITSRFLIHRVQKLGIHGFVELKNLLDFANWYENWFEHLIQIIWSKIIQFSRSRWNDFISFLFFSKRKKNASSPWKLVTNHVLEWMGLNFMIIIQGKTIKENILYCKITLSQLGAPRIFRPSGSTNLKYLNCRVFCKTFLNWTIWVSMYLWKY